MALASSTLAPLIYQIGRFGLVGLLATATHVIFAAVAHYGLGLSALWANGVGYLGAWVVGYVGHYFWTFHATTGHLIGGSRFAVMSVTGFLVNQLIVWLVAVQLGQSFLFADGSFNGLIP